MSSIVLVTGATSGIGRTTALHLASRGFRVIAAGRRPGALDELKAASPHPIETVVMDLDDQPTIARARQEVLAMTGGHGVDVLINNAGWGHVGPVAYTTDEDLRAQFETNVFGTMAVTRAFLPEMRARRAGRVLNVSSVGGRSVVPMMAAYNATKYALEALSDGLRIELAPLGIQVVLIEPGLVKSHFSAVSKDAAKTYAGRGTEYEALVGQTDAIISFTDRMGADPIVLARVMERAITAWWPRARYVAPFHGKVILFAHAVVPTFLMDAAKRLGMGLRKSAMVTPSSAVAAAA